MKVEIKVPPMGESISEATIGTLLKESGSAVAADEEVIELETDKVNQALYAPQAGVLTLTAQPGQKVKIGDVIGFVETEGSAEKPVLTPAQPRTKGAPSPQPSQTPKAAPSSSQPSKAAQGKGARQLKEAFIEDVAAPAEETPPEEEKETPSPQPRAPSSSGRETPRKMSRVRKVIAERLVQAQREAAMLTTFNEADLSEILELREKYKEPFLKAHGVKLGFMSFFVKAVVAALKEYPDFNSYIQGDEIIHREYYDVGVAVGTDKGLFVPVVRECDHLSFAEIEKEIEAYAKRAREGTLAVDDLQGGGFTITNGGVYGSLLSTPILNPPQCGILGMHKIQKRPIALNDQVVIRPMMYLALSYDHRVVDGKTAVSFLVHIKDQLEDPARLQLEIP